MRLPSSPRRSSLHLVVSPVLALALAACGTGGGGTNRDGGVETGPIRDVQMDVRADTQSTPDVQAPDVQAPDVQMPTPDVQMPGPDAFDLCGMASTCEACTGLRGCGFCYGNGTCKPGTASGPTDGNCGPTFWAFGAAATACWGPEPMPEPGPEAGSVDPEPGPEAGTSDVVSEGGDAGSDVGSDASGDGGNPCTDSRSCDDCTDRAECGWCAATAQCLVGTRSGPTGSVCMGSNWQYLTSECSGPTTGTDPCSNYNTCGDCTPRAGCGFCRTDNTCRTGTSEGATRGGACTGTAWNWVLSQCAPPSDPCRAYGGCDTCAGDARCGWCSNNNTCVSATSTGTCSDGSTRPIRNVPECVTAVDPCSLVRVGTGQCLACTAVPGCGLCRDGNRCLRGTAGGPTRTDACTAGNWVFSPIACF